MVEPPAPSKPENPEETKQDEEAPVEKTPEESLIDDKRLFLMNLSYEVTQEEITGLFTKYGTVVDVELPLGKRGRPLGIGFVRFETSEATISAFAELDKSYFQGRKLHIKPAERKQIVTPVE